MRELKISRRRQHTLRDEMYGRDRVMFYEPQEEVALDVKKVLLSEGFYPIGFKSASDLIANATENPPAIFYVCVTDTEGLDTVQRIREHENLHDIFILGGGIRKSDETKAYTAGVNIYIPQPYMWRILPFMIRTLIFMDTLRSIAPDTGSSGEIDLKLFPKEGTIAEVLF
jgi:DNA-binding response OmpR family regulator